MIDEKGITMAHFVQGLSGEIREVLELHRCVKMEKFL